MEAFEILGRDRCSSLYFDTEYFAAGFENDVNLCLVLLTEMAERYGLFILTRMTL